MNDDGNGSAAGQCQSGESDRCQCSVVAHGILRDLQDDGSCRDLGSRGESLGVLDAEYVESAQTFARRSRGYQ
jgi:hypothetical protein